MNGVLPTAVLILVLLGAGAGLSVQAPINAALARTVGGPIFGACVSFLVGFLALFAVSALRGSVSGPASWAPAPWWVYFGGTFGAFFIFASIWSVPKVGVLTAMVTVILGQLVGAMLLDRFGAFGLPVQPVTWQRVGGVALVMSGLVLSRL